MTRSSNSRRCSRSAGSETVTKLVGNAIVLFFRNPGEWQKVCNEPALIPNAVEETLRYWAPSQYQGRYSLADSVWHGVTIPANEPLFLLTGSANRDEREYGNADRVRRRPQVRADRRLRVRHPLLHRCRARPLGGPHRDRAMGEAVATVQRSTKPAAGESPCRTWRATPTSRSAWGDQVVAAVLRSNCLHSTHSQRRRSRRGVNIGRAHLCGTALLSEHRASAPNLH